MSPRSVNSPIAVPGLLAGMAATGRAPRISGFARNRGFRSRSRLPLGVRQTVCAAHCRQRPTSWTQARRRIAEESRKRNRRS